MVFLAAAWVVYLDANLVAHDKSDSLDANGIAHGKPNISEMGKRAVELLDLSLGLLAAYLGGIAYYDLLASAKNSERIVESLSTKGTLLPGALEKITAMLDEPGVLEVRIMCDYADYGYYANFEWNSSYKTKLVMLGRSVRDSTPKVYILSHCESRARKELSERFQNFDSDSAKTQRKAWLEKALISDDKIQLDTFVELLIQRERNWISDLMNFDIECRVTDEPLPLRLWIVKAQENTFSAVVAVPLRTSTEKDAERGISRLRGGEVSWCTNDAHMIDGLIKMFDEYFESAEPRAQQGSN